MLRYRYESSNQGEGQKLLRGSWLRVEGTEHTETMTRQTYPALSPGRAQFSGMRGKRIDQERVLNEDHGYQLENRHCIN